MPDQDPCPPCKIIIDGRVIGSALDALAALLVAAHDQTSREMRAAAILLAGTVRGAVEAFMYGVSRGRFDAGSHTQGSRLDEAHALSELWCHQAKTIREWIETENHDDASGGEIVTKLREWAEYTRVNATRLLGGEYDEERGGFQIIRDERIEKKEE